MTTSSRRRGLLALDLAVALWAVAWLVLGAVVYSELRALRELSDTVVQGSTALEQTGSGLRSTSSGLRETGRALAFVEELPFVGNLVGNELENAADEVDRVADEIEETAEAARVSGEESKDTVDNVALIVGLAVALVPSVLAVAGYLPLRSRRVRRLFGLSGPTN